MSFNWSALPLPHALTDTVPTNAPLVITPLPGLADLSISGPDSFKFLQGQCTTDFREVEKGAVLPGAICSLKGRILFSYLAIPAGDTVHLLLPQDQLADAHAHLKKYSIFSKVTLTAAADAPLLGIQGSRSAAALADLVTPLPVTGHARTTGSGVIVAALASDRFLFVLPSEHAPNVTSSLLAQQAFVSTENAWQLADIRAGLASITTSTRDQFQPQELNYSALAGVSYNKGCYTGQEVVARLYFRGKLKQRLYRLTAEGIAPETISIYAGEQQVGNVVNMARNENNGIELLAVVKNTAISAGRLSLGPQGPALQVQDLPYPLDADKEE
jgi:folate-binding protein YgfZ